jgi:hypothetical protein
MKIMSSNELSSMKVEISTPMVRLWMLKSKVNALGFWFSPST